MGVWSAWFRDLPYSRVGVPSVPQSNLIFMPYSGGAEEINLEQLAQLRQHLAYKGVGGSEVPSTPRLRILKAFWLLVVILHFASSAWNNFLYRSYLCFEEA